MVTKTGFTVLANNADPDQTAPKEQSDLSLHCLLSQSVQTFALYTVAIIVPVYELLNHKRQFQFTSLLL